MNKKVVTSIIVVVVVALLAAAIIYAPSIMQTMLRFTVCVKPNTILKLETADEKTSDHILLDWHHCRCFGNRASLFANSCEPCPSTTAL